MKPDKPESPSEVAESRRFALLAILASASFTGLVLTALSLSTANFPVNGRLYVTYLWYSVCVLVFLHSAVFLRSAMLASRGRALSRNLPRYLEYAYALLLSVGLAQVLFMSSQFSAYVTLVSGDESELVSRISKQASLHLNEDCKKGGQFFTKDYCEQLQKIVDSKSPNQYITSVVIFDDKFLAHTVRREMRPAGHSAMLVDVPSPIARFANAIRAQREYATSPVAPNHSRAFSWIAVLLLPIGIGLRVLKTSVELFGNQT